MTRKNTDFESFNRLKTVAVVDEFGQRPRCTRPGRCPPRCCGRTTAKDLNDYFLRPLVGWSRIYALAK
jgi:hypothetical protein